MTDVATTFLELQQQRHLADYDHLADFSRPQVITNADRARLAVTKLGQLSNSHDGQTFFVLVAMHKALR